jgi:hypothetical protein
MKTTALALLLVASPAYACDWQVSRSVDPMTDQAKCLITSPTSQLGVGTRGSDVMFVIGGKLPHDPFKVRVDDHPAHFITRKGVSTQAFEPDARDLLADLATGTVVRTQHTRWPDRTEVNSEAPICNLPALIRSCVAPQKAN